MRLAKVSKDLTGQVFGSLKAVRPHHTKNNMVYWEYLCSCGNTHIARGNTISYIAKKGDPDVPSCGCVELARKTKHGFRKVKNTHPAYRAYRAMLDRCYNSKTSSFKWYGEKGVTVCDTWKNDPAAFVKWSIENGWKPGLVIDKDILCKQLSISPGIYSPETCQWITKKENVGFATNRDNYGKHPNVKLSHADVTEIRRRYYSGEETNKAQLARDFELLSPSSIYRLFE